MEDYLQWFDDLQWKMTWGGWRPSVEDDFRWKTSCGGKRPSVEDDLQWKMTLIGSSYAAYSVFFINQSQHFWGDFLSFLRGLKSNIENLEGVGSLLWGVCSYSHQPRSFFTAKFGPLIILFSLSFQPIISACTSCLFWTPELWSGTQKEYFQRWSPSHQKWSFADQRGCISPPYDLVQPRLLGNMAFKILWGNETNLYVIVGSIK